MKVFRFCIASPIQNLPCLAVLLASILSAASTQAQPATSSTPKVLGSVPPAPQPNPALEAAILRALIPVQINDGQGHGPDPTSVEGKLAVKRKLKVECERMPTHRYTWSRVDLNGDSRSELIAQVVGPTFCGTGGCPLLIFREPSPGNLILLTQISLFKDPLIVTKRRHNSWKKLIVRVRVNAASSYYAELLYDGHTYPTNPSVPPAMPLDSSDSGTAYLEWISNDPRAHALRCEATKR